MKKSAPIHQHRLTEAGDAPFPARSSLQIVRPHREVFASILVRDVGQKLAAGIDLSEFEVKSALDGGSYEYQCHKNTGKRKLRRDAEVGHLFFDHRDNLRRVDLRYAHGSDMKEFFTKWLQEYPDPYPQRYRKNMPFHWVEKHALLLMTLRDGEVTYPPVAPVSPKKK